MRGVTIFSLFVVFSLAIFSRIAGGAGGATALPSRGWADPQGQSMIVASGVSELVWQSRAGCRVTIGPPLLSLRDSKSNTTSPLSLTPKARSIEGRNAMLEYAISSKEGESKITGVCTLKLTASSVPDDDGLLTRTTISFAEPLNRDVHVEFVYGLQGRAPDHVALPGRDGILRLAAFPAGGSFDLGHAGGEAPWLGMPVIGCLWDDGEGTQLAAAADPYCGSTIEARYDAQHPQITISATYPGSLVPVASEQRTISLEFHRRGIDGSLRSYYRTIPEIDEGAPWTQGIQLGYYDYLSDKGQGWFNNLQALANRIPAERRGHVVACLHGWYDYFQHYGFDQAKQQLMKKWTAFPGTFKVPMSLTEMHRRMKFAKDLGFHVLLYFSDGTNSDSGAPDFHPEFVLKDQNGKSFPGWKGPDSVGQPLMMDPSVPGVRQWYHDYLKALLEEYAGSVDGFVWDETFYIRANQLSYTQSRVAYGDRAMMSLVSELTQLTQSYKSINPNLVFLASDCAATNYALVSNGTYQDTAMDERAWAPSMFANYRNCLWSCNWFPIKNVDRNEIAADKFGIAQGLSDGWGDDCGPARMPANILDPIIARFTRNVTLDRQRLRYMTP